MDERPAWITIFEAHDRASHIKDQPTERRSHMASVNKVILLGNLGQDPKVHQTQSGTSIAMLRLATTRRVKQPSGEYTSETEWHSVVFFGRSAEIARDYLRKGSPLYLEGRLRTRKWTDQNGQDRYTTEVVGEVLQLLGSKSDGQGAGQQSAQRTASSSGGFPEEVPF